MTERDAREAAANAWDEGYEAACEENEVEDGPKLSRRVPNPWRVPE